MDQTILDNLRQLTIEEKEILQGNERIDTKRYMKSQYSSIIDSKKLLEKGKLIDIRTHTRFVDFPQHSHNYVEVVYMCQGQLEHIINGEKVVQKKGELLFLNQSAVHKIQKAGIEDIAVNFIILPEFFDRSLLMAGQEENLIRDFIISCLRNENRSISFLHFKVKDVLPVQNLVENLIWTLMNKQQNKRNINQITMGLLILQLINHSDIMIASGDNLEQEILIKVYNFIENHYCNGELSDLAKELNYDLYWLSRLIKKQTGITYTELLQTKKLSQAVYLLQTTSISIADIGYAIGYNNLSYFYRIFKKKYNKTPKQFRETRK